jgi:TRAP-type mannitol/chloroaromatic compound transport system permease small subunit
MLGGAFAAIGVAYVFYHNANVRIDLFYSKFSPKVKLIVDTVCGAVFFFPVFLMFVWIFSKNALFSYSVQELATESTWYPIVWPYKTLVAIGFCLGCLQGTVMFVKDVLTLKKGGKKPW